MKKLLALVVIVGLWIGYYFGNKSVQVDPVVSSEVTVAEVDLYQKDVPTFPIEQSYLFSFNPPVQPSIHGTREENNKILWQHIADSSNKFNIANAKYVRVFLEKDLACNRDLLIGINGRSMGVVRQNLNCWFMNASQDSRSAIVFELDAIPVVQNWETKVLNLFDYTNVDWELDLSFAVGETDNFVTLIEVE